MAEVVQEKSRALKFAEHQLLRHGWEHGKGLGRSENGISEAIKVKVKCGKGGVGHKEGEQFTFHWWDHVFNKASSSLQVESDQNGIKLKKTVEEDEEGGMVSNKKPRKATLAKEKLYGCFVKSATLLCGQEQPEPKVSNSDSSSSSSSSDDEADQRLDLSSTTKLTDANLMKACGGRTAHKGARHGLTMSAKLARLEQQEAEFMAKYGNKSQTQSASPVSGKPAQTTITSSDERAEDAQSKKLKKKSSRSANELNGSEVSESPEPEVQPKKKKKKKKKKRKAENDTEEITDAVSAEEAICAETGEADKTKRKRKKKKNNEVEITTLPAAERESQEETAEPQADTQVKKKKKKKKSSKRHNEEEAITDSSQSHATHVPESVQEAEVAEEESTIKQNRTKCKKDKPIVENKVKEEALPPKKKKKKSRD